MTLWLRVRRTWVLAATCVAMVVVASLISGAGFALPAIFGSLGYVSWSAFVPLGWSIALADALSAKTQAVEARVSRRLVVHDLVLYVAATAVAAAAFGTVQASTADGNGSAVAQVLVLSGLAGLLTLRLGSAAAVLGCSSLVVATSLYGPDAAGAGYVRVLQPDGDVAWALGLGVVLCVATCVLVAARRTTVVLGSADRLTA